MPIDSSTESLESGLGFHLGLLWTAIGVRLQVQRLRGETRIGVGGLGLRGLSCCCTMDRDIELKMAMWRS